MGGGIALLCAQALAIWHPDLSRRVEGIYTFGSPHLGDAAFCRQFVESLGRKALNFTHGVDIVPRLPPKLLEYTDACYQEWYLTTTGHVYVHESEVCTRLPYWQILLCWLIVNIFRRLVFSSSESSHSGQHAGVRGQAVLSSEGRKCCHCLEEHCTRFWAAQS